MPTTPTPTELPFPTSTAQPGRPTFPTDGAGVVPHGPGIDRPGFDSAAPKQTPRSAMSWIDGADPALPTDDLVARIAQSAHETIDRLAASAAPHVDRLQEKLTADALRQRGEQMREMGDEWTESLRDTVRDNPLAAVGVALAVGLLIARVTR